MSSMTSANKPSGIKSMLEVRIMMNKLNVIFKTYSYVKYD
jgi:hypothetical protein